MCTGDFAFTISNASLCIEAHSLLNALKEAFISLILPGLKVCIFLYLVEGHFFALKVFLALPR